MQLLEELWCELRLAVAGARASFYNGCDNIVGELFDANLTTSPNHRDFDDLESSLQFGDCVLNMILYYIFEIFSF